MKTNRPQSYRQTTYEGGTAAPHQTPAQELERAVATCLLGEDTYYESGLGIKERIADLCAKVEPYFVADLAVKARNEWKLRHVPLWLARQLCRTAPLQVGRVLERIIQRPDEITEFLALYWASNDGKRTLPAQVKKGLAKAFTKFNAYQLAKWNRDGVVKLRDALFLSHAKPENEEQAALWKQLVEGTLPTPDTWEVSISAAKTAEEKKAAWVRLLTERKLGDMALLMNLRNLVQCNVPMSLVAEEMGRRRWEKILPFRFLSAWRAAPAFARQIDQAMLASLANVEKFPGAVAIVVDVSGSMDVQLSQRGQLSRIDAAAALAVLLGERCDFLRTFTFSQLLTEVPSARGLGLVEAIYTSQPHHGTYLGRALAELRTQWLPEADWLFVLTDEQVHDQIPMGWATRGNYLINVAPYQPALPTTQGGWTRISGFSERILDWIEVSQG